MESISLREARRIALRAQGFGNARPNREIALADLRRTIRRMALIQIDSVNALVRSHYLPLFSRLGPYRLNLLDKLVYERRELFEYWAHEASFVPIEYYPLMRHRMESWRRHKGARRMADEHPAYFQAVMDEVRTGGPLAAGELSDPGGRQGPWWGYGKGKVALEWHFQQGRLAIAGRRNFARLYDIPERVIPRRVLEQEAPTAEHAQRELLLISARAHGVGTARDLADYFRLTVPETKPRLAELVDSGALLEAEVEGWRERAYLAPEAASKPVSARALLSPFDPLVWERQRAERLFGFHYRIGLYTPAAQRTHGYYVLPFLLGDVIAGRADLKADRANGTLRVLGAFNEDHADPAYVAPALAAEILEMARWLGLRAVTVNPNGDLAEHLLAVEGLSCSW